LTTLLVSPTFLHRYRAQVEQAAPGLEFVVLPEDGDARLSDADCALADIAYFSGDIFPGLSRSFFAAAQSAANLKWIHVFNAGVDNPVFQRLLERGIRLTTSSGSTAQPIAQTAIAGMLMLSRGFEHWGEAQSRHAWEPLRAADTPADLAGQTMVVYGLGAIGSEIARLARSIGLYVIGIRRSLLRPGDPVDELRPPWALPELLPRTDWLALACPLTEETRHLIARDQLAALPPTARILNIARGEVIDEDALIEALREKRIAGAYLDVFRTEPLPAESPLWGMPGVIVTPHNSAAALGNEGRASAFFLRNLKAWVAGEPMENEVRA
jgi:phosphoglycerate dehydrogenase-like enzyme